MRFARHRHVMAAALACAILAGLTTGCGLSGEEDGATRVARSFLQAWQDGHPDKAASFTDDPKAARAELTRLHRELRVEKAKLKPGPRKEGGKEKGKATATVPFDAALTLAGGGTWRYESVARVLETTDGWKVRFIPSLLHPELERRTHFVRYRELPPRAGILAAGGSALAERGTVWVITIWPAKLTDPDRAYKALADPALGADIDLKALKSRVRKAAPHQSVPVVTLRDAVYRKVRDRLLPIPGLQFRDIQRSLATRAKPLVGSVQPATKETLRNAGRMAAPFDEVGANGLQYRYQRQLAGKPGITVRVVDKETKEVLREVYRSEPKPGKPVNTTIDSKTQQAAEAALAQVAKRGKGGSLVALKPSTGAVLAVANTPGRGDNRAFTGRYAPGSTFKVVTTAALLQAGVDPGLAVPCPRTLFVDGQKFENQAEFELPSGATFRENFTQSCNTGIIGLRGRLDGEALRSAAEQFGIGAEWRVGASSFDGSFPLPRGENEKAAGMIGQGRVEASVLVMASVAATVKEGSFLQPVLVPAAVPETERYKVARKLPSKVAERLRTLMRAVVTEGPGEALRELSGAPAAKTGTAEYGTGTPPRTHAWMIGYRGDLAFAVLLEDGGSGGKDAGPVAARFLRKVD